MVHYVGIQGLTGEFVRLGSQPNTIAIRIKATDTTMMVPVDMLIDAGMLHVKTGSDTPYLDYPEIDILDASGNNLNNSVDRAWVVQNSEAFYRVQNVTPGDLILKVSAIVGARGTQGKQGLPGTPGVRGEPGDAAGFGDVTAEVLLYDTYSKPSVEVDTSGENTEKDIHFVFRLPETDSVYTAFEVYPNSVDIPAGNSEGLGGNVSEKIPANTIHRMVIRTLQPNPLASDVWIDWGDGTTSSIKDKQYNVEGVIDASDKYNYTFEHDYSESLNKYGVTQRRYTIKIYGYQYWGIMHRVNGKSSDSSNLMCSALGDGLPVAPHLNNMVGFCAFAKRILKVTLGSMSYRDIEQCQYMFTSCTNMISATGFARTFTRSNCGMMFYNCYNMTTCDAQLPLESLRNASANSMYENCKKLSVDINDLIPSVIGSLGPYNTSKAFYNCQKLKGTVPDKLLWNSTDRLWKNTSECFKLCRSLDLDIIPKSWGGNMDDPTEYLVQVDWDQSDSMAIDYIRHKPDISAIINESITDRQQVDWNQTDTKSPGYIKNKPNVPTKVSDLSDYKEYANVQSNWEEDDFSSPAYIRNRPTIPSSITQLKGYKEFVNVQADWNQTDPNNDSYIKNKPEIVTNNTAVQRLCDLGSSPVVTLAKMERNTVYICTGKVVSLDVLSVDDGIIVDREDSSSDDTYPMYIGSMFESEICFTASLSGVSVNLPHNVRIIGDTSFHNGSSYVISIKNNLAVSVCYA